MSGLLPDSSLPRTAGSTVSELSRTTEALDKERSMDTQEIYCSCKRVMRMAEGNYLGGMFVRNGRDALNEKLAA